MKNLFIFFVHKAKQDRQGRRSVSNKDMAYREKFTVRIIRLFEKRIVQCVFFVGAWVWTALYAADERLGLIGGTNIPGAAYTASVAPDGLLTELTGGGLPTSGGINSVALNSQGTGLVGGYDISGGVYAALIYPNSATLTQLAGGGIPTMGGSVNTVALNNAGRGLIGGDDTNGLQPAFAALVVPDSTTLLQLTGSAFPSISGTIDSVAINDAGRGLIGGRDTNSSASYIASLSPDSTTLVPLTGGGLPANGSIYSVAINNGGTGLIGGENVVSSSAYAAFVAPDGTLTQLTGGGIPSSGSIRSVAINSSGAGLIGGIDGVNAYAALVTPNSSTLTQLTGGGLPTPGLIDSVAINKSGEGIIGGWNTGSFLTYAALVAPNGSLTQLTGGGLPVSGEITSVAINEAGVSLIGGFHTGGAAYAALVAPNGTLTELSGSGMPATGQILSVAMPLAQAAQDAVTPRSAGAYGSPVNTQLAAAHLLDTRFTMQSRLWKSAQNSHEISLLADAEIYPGAIDESDALNRQESSSVLPIDQLPAQSKYSIWAAPFNNYVHIQSQGKIPSFTNEIAGMLAAFDHQSSNLLLGGLLGYAFNYVQYANGLGHGKIQQEMACFYGSYKKRRVRINAALWGGLYQLHNERHPFAAVTATGHTHGWILSPHLELAAPFTIAKNNQYFVEPFLLFDWVNNWQSHFTETGASGFNLVMRSQYASLLQSEFGLRFYEQWLLNWGDLILEEKLSYLNQAPFHVQNMSTAFVGSISTFPVATGSSTVQNLGGVELCGTLLPRNPKFPYGVLAFQGTFGPSYQSYFCSLQIGRNF